MKRYFLVYLSIFLLQFLGVGSTCASSVIEQNDVSALKPVTALPSNPFNILHETCKLNGASKHQDLSSFFLFEVEEDDERTNTIPSTVPSSRIKISESKGWQLPEEVESYPISSNSCFFYSTEQYIYFCSIRV